MTQTNSPNPGQGDFSTAIATTFWVNGVAAGISAAVTAETARAEAAETTVAATAASAASAAATAATVAATASSAVTTLTATVASDFAAALVSPAFTGTPTAPTAVASTNTTQIATTAFVEAAIASIAPGFQTLVDSASIAWNIGGLSIAAATLTLGASGRHLTITGFVAGGQYRSVSRPGIWREWNDYNVHECKIWRVNSSHTVHGGGGISTYYPSSRMGHLFTGY